MSRKTQAHTGHSFSAPPVCELVPLMGHSSASFVWLDHMPLMCHLCAAYGPFICQGLCAAYAPGYLPPECRGFSGVWTVDMPRSLVSCAPVLPTPMCRSIMCRLCSKPTQTKAKHRAHPRTALGPRKRNQAFKIAQMSAKNQRLKLSTTLFGSRRREEANRGHETAQRETRKIRCLTP